jgi:hypothetical protein
MRFTTRALLALPLLFAVGPAAFADEAAEKLAAQKKNAEENWEALEIGPAAHAETAHLLVYAPKSFDKRIKDVGAALEKYYEQARKPLGYEKESPWPGKLTVYLLPEREDFTKFVRRVEKRRVEAEDAGSHLADGDFPHAVGGPPRAKTDPAVESQAGEQIATAMLVKKAGTKVPLPGWLLNGFGRATGYRTRPADKAVGDERRRAAALVKKGSKASEIWGSTLGAEDEPLLEASLADFLAYGPGQSKFAPLLEAFKPEENQEKKTTEQALEAVSLPADRLNTRWREWAANPR